jgi:hypothetical protein
MAPYRTIFVASDGGHGVDMDFEDEGFLLRYLYLSAWDVALRADKIASSTS